jgi:hypothetical protein
VFADAHGALPQPWDYREGLGRVGCGQISSPAFFANRLPGAGSMRLNGSTMNQSEFRNYHEREAARLRSLLATATTPALKARLLEEAEKHEQLAEEFEDLIEATAA